MSVMKAVKISISESYFFACLIQLAYAVSLTL